MHGPGQDAGGADAGELKAVSDLFEADVYDALNLENCMALRSSWGGPAVSETTRQIGEIEQFIQKIKEKR